jgi:hypothetical protein
MQESHLKQKSIKVCFTGAQTGAQDRQKQERKGEKGW